MEQSNNAFYQVTDYLIKTIEEIQLNNTVIFAQSENKDIYNNNIYPLTHINPILKPQSLGNGSLSFEFEIGVLNQRISDNTSENTDKLFNNYNLVDNFNVTSSIVNELISTLILNRGGEFTIDNITDANPIYYEDINGLDGWVFSVTISLANNVTFC